MSSQPKTNLLDPEVLRELFYNSQIVFSNPTFQLLSDEQLRTYVQRCAWPAEARLNQNAMYTLLTQRATTPEVFDTIMNMYRNTLASQDPNLSDSQKEELMQQVQHEVKEKVYESEVRRQQAEKLAAKLTKQVAAANNDLPNDEDIHDVQPEPVCMFKSQVPANQNNSSKPK